MPDSVAAVLAQLKNDHKFMSCVTAWQTFPSRPGSYVALPSLLDLRLKEALKAQGISQLYTHQARSFEAIRNGQHVVVVTPTASGKTLCYNLPVVQHLLNDPKAKALYLFPTKALAQDQQAELNELALASQLGLKVATYDGDTPSSLRTSIRDTGQLIISNPDMLHTAILPNHPKWIKFLKNLSFVVIDEMHTYRGIFGSHFTNLLRRLKRIAAFYGSKPQFILCSATIGNAQELAERLIEEKVVLIDENGSPSGERHLIFYNPPLVDRVQGIRRSVVNVAQELALLFLKKRIKTIVFSRSRLRTELIASYIRRALNNFFNENHHLRVESYRGGYLPSERRAIEKGLRSGEILGVVSTNALELGIDIGGLDCAILAGFPGSVASTWQQAGRAGRRLKVSVSIIIASSSPLNQYIINHPEYFLGTTPESGYIDPNNLLIQLDHLKCAVFELPFAADESFSPQTPELLNYLEEQGVIRLSESKYYWADRSYPAEQISLRSASSENVVIIDQTDGRHPVIGEMDRPSAKELLFENAVYLHRGEQYLVEKLDIANKKALVRQADLNYYTDAIVKTDIKVLHEDEKFQAQNLFLVLGDILVRSQATKFKKLRFHTHENLGYGDIFLPPEEMHTRMLALIFDPQTKGGSSFESLAEILKPQVIARLAYLIQNVAPLFLLCDIKDLGISEKLRDPHFMAPCIYIYDHCPGGSGLAEGFKEKLPQILKALQERLLVCPCQEGCPSCLGPVDPQETSLKQNLKETLKDFLKAWV